MPVGVRLAQDLRPHPDPLAVCGTSCRWFVAGPTTVVSREPRGAPGRSRLTTRVTGPPPRIRSMSRQRREGRAWIRGGAQEASARRMRGRKGDSRNDSTSFLLLGEIAFDWPGMVTPLVNRDPSGPEVPSPRDSLLGAERCRIRVPSVSSLRRDRDSPCSAERDTAKRRKSRTSQEIASNFRLRRAQRVRCPGCQAQLVELQDRLGCKPPFRGAIRPLTETPGLGTHDAGRRALAPRWGPSST